MTIHRSLGALATLSSAAMLASCGPKGVQDITAPAPGAAVKFFNFGINAPTVNFYANDTKLTAISSTTGTESTAGTAFGSAGAGGLYVGVAPGQYTLSGRITTTADNGVAIASTPASLESGKWYSYFLSGNYDATSKKTDAFVVEDPLPPVDATKTYVRFVNAISNSTPLTLYLKPATGAELPVGGAVAYKSAGAFTQVPDGLYDLNVRTTGSSVNLITRTGVTFSVGRVYTISARGDITVTSTTATNRPILDSFANR